MNRIKAGIIGASGYTGSELLRLLLLHPNVDLTLAYSRSKAGLRVEDVFRDLSGDTDLQFTNRFESTRIPDVLFLCLGHGESAAWLQKHSVPESCLLIDLSQDFRLHTNASGFVYGLPEINREHIRRARRVANPGCFATAIQLALLPLAENGLLQTEVHIQAITGSTGAGQSLSETSHFSWRQSNLSVYKAFRHQHLSEIKQSLGRNNAVPEITLIPQRGPFARGIMANAVMSCNRSLEQITALFQDYYREHPFVFAGTADIDLKQVINTNKCLLQLQQSGDKLLISAVIDNLLKGASGQAVQNMNLMAGFEEKEGLALKAVAY